MKNSDMKVIAVILAIALFFTIVTSNAVSIASVVLLALDSTKTEAPVNTGNQNTQNNVSTPTGNTTVVNPSGNSNTTPSGNTNTTPSGNTTSDTNKPADNSSSNAPAGAIDKEALAMFQKAAKDINDNAVAGFKKKNWQTVAQDLHLNQLPSLSGRLSDMIESFMTSEADAEVKVSAKGSDDAKNRMPACNATEATIASVTKKEEGSNIVITIVMKDSLNPGLEDTDGLTAMSDDLLYIKYVTDTIESNSFVNALVKELTKGDINYVAFTITATMTKDGKFVEIRHDGDGMIDAAAQTILGEVSGTGGIAFHARFYDFEY